MKRRELVRLLEKEGCYVTREGGNHSIYLNPATGGKRYDLGDGPLVALVTAIIRLAVEDLCNGRKALGVPFRARNRTHRRDHDQMVEAHDDAVAFFKNGRLPMLLKCAGLQETLDPELIRERAFRRAGVRFK